MSSKALEGNGVGIIRELGKRELRLATVIQNALERLYQLDRVANVSDFAVPAENGRETLFLREAADGALEIALHLPDLAERDLDLDSGDIDPLCQVIEGVSHFVYVSQRADSGRETTALEMELQAEVDKWVVLGASMPSFDVRTSQRLRERLYDRITYLHSDASELGERYRVANDAAARFVRDLEKRYLAQSRFLEMRNALRTFFRHGQEEKIRLGRAA